MYNANKNIKRYNILTITFSNDIMEKRLGLNILYMQNIYEIAVGSQINDQSPHRLANDCNFFESEFSYIQITGAGLRLLRGFIDNTKIFIIS